MNTIFRVTFISFLFVTAIFCSSCKKEIAGPKGDTGAPGKDGTLNVSNIDPLVLNETAWVVNKDSTTWTAIIFSDKITQEILDKGMVEVYFKKNDTWWALPYAEGDETMVVGISLGRVNMSLSDSHGGLPERPSAATYRVVIVSASAAKAAKGLDSKDYKTQNLTHTQ